MLKDIIKMTATYVAIVCSFTGAGFGIASLDERLSKSNKK